MIPDFFKTTKCNIIPIQLDKGLIKINALGFPYPAYTSNKICTCLSLHDNIWHKYDWSLQAATYKNPCCGTGFMGDFMPVTMWWM